MCVCVRAAGGEAHLALVPLLSTVGGGLAVLVHQAEQRARLHLAEARGLAAAVVPSAVAEAQPRGAARGALALVQLMSDFAATDLTSKATWFGIQ